VGIIGGKNFIVNSFGNLRKIVLSLFLNAYWDLNQTSMIWNTDEIVGRLTELCKEKNIPVVVDKHQPGGDYDTWAVSVKPLNQPDDDTADDAVTACGFNTSITMDSIEQAENPKHLIPYVEVRNNYSDSDGGLGIDSNEPIQQVYLIVRNYFRQHPVEIIRHYNQIF
jgi:hypothetical protein